MWTRLSCGYVHLGTDPVIFKIFTSRACIKTLLSPANPFTATYRLPCQRRVVRFLCTPPIRRTDSIPSCACASAGPPRGLDQSVGTSPDPQSWDSAPSSPSPAREWGVPGEPGLCICLSNTTPSSGPAPKCTEERGLKKDSEAEMSKPWGFYPHSPDPVFHQRARAVRPCAWVERKSSSAFCCVALLFFPDWRLKMG